MRRHREHPDSFYQPYHWEHTQLLEQAFYMMAQGRYFSVQCIIQELPSDLSEALAELVACSDRYDRYLFNTRYPHHHPLYTGI